MPRHRLNTDIAERLIEAAGLLDQQGADTFRVKAYARAAEVVAEHGRSIADILAAKGFDALAALFGEAIGATVAGMARKEHWPLLDRLRGDSDPVALFRSVPGLGRETALRIHDELHIDTLTALEAASVDGRLAAVRGFGPRRVATIQTALGKRLDRLRARPRPAAGATLSEPTVEAILHVDALYRAGAEAGQLPRLAPRRFNAERRAWLPILHTRRGDWRFTALYANSAHSHGKGRADDWVAIHFYDREHREGQRAVFTETRGDLAGRRIVQGREAECRGHYAAAGRAAARPKRG